MRHLLLGVSVEATVPAVAKRRDRDNQKQVFFYLKKRIIKMQIGKWKITALFPPVVYSLDEDKYIFLPPTFFYRIHVVDGHLLRYLKIGWILVEEGHYQ